MKKTLFAVATALITFSAMPASSESRSICGDRSEFVDKLQDSYAEKPVSLGLAANGSMLEVFASENGTFTIVLTQPSGASCLVIAGDNWQRTRSNKTEIKL